MDFNFTEEQQLLANAVQRFVREHYSFEARRDILRSSTGWSREIWQELAGLGITALNVPEEYGGMSAGPVETMLVMDEIGKGLLLEPYFSAAVFTPALITQVDDKDAAGELLPEIASGERIVVVAHQEAAARGTVQFVSTRAERSGDNYILDGAKSVITHAGAADELLVSARTSGNANDSAGVSLFRIDPQTSGVTLKSYATLDGQRAADIKFEKVKIAANRRIGREGDAMAALEKAHDIALSALCAEAVGIMRALVDTTVEYTKSRKQFGQPIAKFQALQHRMADMLLHTEQAQSMSYLAAIRCTESDTKERRRAMSAAKVAIGQAGRYVGQQAVQLHGGMGMTDELIVSHYFKRLTAIELSLGDTDHHLQQFIGVTTAA